MKKAVLDTNFILTCVKQKIDFFDEIRFMGLEIVIPEEVLFELKKIQKSGSKLHSRNTARLALKILEKNQFKKINLGTKNVDKGLVELAEKDREITIATLDKELKYKIKRPILLIRGRKKLKII